MPISRRRSRPKVFGPGCAIPLDREQKVRVMAYARAWSALHREARQHTGPITRTFMEVLRALLWGFHNGPSGRCYPSHEAIAAKVGCCKDTVIEALKVLERAGIVGWEHRLVWVRKAIGGAVLRFAQRTSNAYWFNDRSLETLPQRVRSENPTGTRIKIPSLPSCTAPERAPTEGSDEWGRWNRDRQLALLLAG